MSPVGVGQHRVLHVVTTVEPGGAESHLRDLAAGTRARGHAVDVAYLRGDRAHEAALAGRGVRAFPLGGGRRPGPGTIAALARLIGRRAYTVVHAHLIEAELVAALALSGRAAPSLVVSKHNDDPFWRRAPARLLARWVGRRARRVIAISEHVRRAFIELGLPAAKIETVHYGLEACPAPSAAEARRRLGVPVEGRLIGAVGRLVPQKGHDVLIDALAALGERHRDARSVIVGGGPLAGALADRARARGLEGRVRLAGHRADAAGLIGGFEVFAHPSRWEGFGLVLLEAMARARPIVASRVSAVPEIVLDRQTGLLVEPDAPGRLAEALRELLDDPAEGRRLGERGRERLRDEFTVARMVDRTLAVYDRAVE